MASPFGPALSVILGVAAIMIPLVAPMYYLVLDMRGDRSTAESERGHIEEEQSDISDTLESLQSEVQDLHEDVQRNHLRSEQNQRHIHQLLVGKIDDDDNEIGNPHYQADHCPLPDECPYHDHDAGE